MEAKVGFMDGGSVSITDVGSLFSGSNVENILQEIGLTSTEDATYITVKRGSTTLFRIVKATGNLQAAGGFDSDVTFP